MIAVPAVDLRGGHCVQLVGGRPWDERISIPDPVAVANRWWDLGFRSLHLVDLDAALETGDNRALLFDVAAATEAETQAGGGVRTDEAAADLLAQGIDRVVVGTRAVEDPQWVEGLALRHPGAVVVAADVRDGQVLTRGWTDTSGLQLTPFLESLADLPLAGVLCTDVAREGRMVGVDPGAIRALVSDSPHPVWVSGGIGSIDDLAVIADAGAAGAVMGMALYTGALDAGRVGKEWGE
jgi:phosphoribosylformimino-5-aminoimidazole carboxamide ribotide isomerase